MLAGAAITGEGTPNPISVNVRRRNHRIAHMPGFEIVSPDTNNLAEELRRARRVRLDLRDPELKRTIVQGEHVEAIAECLIAKGAQR